MSKPKMSKKKLAAQLKAVKQQLKTDRAAQKAAEKKLSKQLEACKKHLLPLEKELKKANKQLKKTKKTLFRVEHTPIKKKTSKKNKPKKIKAKTKNNPKKSSTVPIKTILQEDIKLDDLKKIEGIGAKIEMLLNSNGVSTFDKLAETSPEFLKEILSKAGTHYSLHDPTTWPEQAALAANEKWETLSILQEELKGGRRV